MGREAWTKPVVDLWPTKKRTKTIVGFWHIGALGDWQRIVAEQYVTLRACGLYDASDRIVVGFIGGMNRQQELNTPAIPILGDPKFEVFATEDVEDYEFPTLARVWREAQERDDPFLCFYLHTKGASLMGTRRREAASAWRAYMEYFNLERWMDCVDILETHETCGVELQSKLPAIARHYSGNFWWATSDYVRKLPEGYQYWEQNSANRGAAEFYVCLAGPKAHCFNDFVENLYDYAVPPSRYRK